VRHVARELLGKMALVVRIDLRIIASARHWHIRQPTIHEFFSCLLRIHVNGHVVDGLTLAALARYCVSVGEMRVVFDVERDGAA